MAGTLPSKAEMTGMSWRQPLLPTVTDVYNQMMLCSRGRDVKLWRGELVKKKGLPSSGHWICGLDWEKFKEYAMKESLPCTGAVGMIEFYRWVKTTPGCCGFTMVAQEMDEVQYLRMSWRLHPVAS